ncbi:MAG: leucine-rich repeat domain-containing protein [Oscillospiraceae bacterium]|nr:leucine-rich repeat domain-containing protein [Oscillospiraceae bacterium]
MKEKTNHRIYKNVLLLFVVTVLCALFAVSVSAETYGDFFYAVLDDGTIEITGYTGNSDYVDIPSQIDEKNVTSIGNSAFGGCQSLRTVEIPFGVQSIGEEAFGSCMSLEKIEIPESVKTIGEGAFSHCISLTKAVLPSGLKSIEPILFKKCYKLAEIEIPESIEKIGSCAFLLCKSLKTVVIPGSVKKIDVGAFMVCPTLERITVDANNMYYSSDENGVLYDKDKTVLIQYPIGNKRMEFKMPDSVTKIDYYAFAGGIYLEKLQFSKNLQRMEECAFAFCLLLEDIELPESVEYVGIGVFYDIYKLKNITIKSMNAQFDGAEDIPIGSCEFKLKDNVNFEEFFEKLEEPFICSDTNERDRLIEGLLEYMIFDEEKYYFDYTGTIRCHAGSTAETYAKENGVDYELVHFFGDWVYDWENLVRSRECSICGYIETQPLEKDENGEIDIIKPVDPDTEFIVEEITKNGDKYAVVEKSLNENLEESFSIIKTFDITLQNKDGVHVQPDGIVKVKLPLDWDKDGNYKVYRVNDDGTLTDMEAYREGSHMVFETDHFSLYVIVDESEQKPDDTPERDFFQKIFDWFRQLLDLLIALFK